MSQYCRILKHFWCTSIVENIIFTFFRTWQCYPEAHKTGTQKMVQILVYQYLGHKVHFSSHFKSLSFNLMNFWKSPGIKTLFLYEFSKSSKNYKIKKFLIALLWKYSYNLQKITKRSNSIDKKNVYYNSWSNYLCLWLTVIKGSISLFVLQDLQCYHFYSCTSFQ